MKTVAALTTHRPTTTQEASRLSQGTSRLAIDLPRSMHKRLRLAAVEQDVTVRTLVLGLLRQAGFTD